MTPPAPPEVFVSYSSRDAAAVHPFADRLAGANVGVWLDKHRIPPGQCFFTEIAAGVRQARVVVLMCSPAALASVEVRREVSIAWINGAKSYIPVWLTPPAPYPPEFEYFLTPVQYVAAANRPPEDWFAEVLRGLDRFGVRRDRPRPPASVDDLRAAVREKDWRRAVAAGEAVLAAHPGSAQVRQAVESARGWVRHEDEAVLAGVRAGGTPAAWEAYLARFPDGPLADHARFRIAADLPLPRVPEFLRRCQAAAAGLGPRVAAAVCQLRLKNRPAARAELDGCRAADPGNAAAAFFLAVARLTAVGLGRLTLDHLRPAEELTRAAAGLAPGCGYPDLFHALLAAEYYEPNRLRGPFGPSAELFRAAAARGLGRADYDSLRGLFD